MHVNRGCIILRIYEIGGRATVNTCILQDYVAAQTLRRHHSADQLGWVSGVDAKTISNSGNQCQVDRTNAFKRRFVLDAPSEFRSGVAPLS